LLGLLAKRGALVAGVPVAIRGKLVFKRGYYWWIIGF